MDSERRSPAATRRPGLFRLRAKLLCFMLCLPACGAPLLLFAAEVRYEPVQIKAAYLYNFTKFVDWPTDRFASAESALVIGVSRDGPLHQQLQKVVRDRTVNNRSIVVKIIDSDEDVRSVHLLFVASGDEFLVDQAAGTHTAGPLTVGESERFTALGGCITFVARSDKIQFEINQTAAEQAGLKLNARLLSLAVVVRKKP